MHCILSYSNFQLVCLKTTMSESSATFSSTQFQRKQTRSCLSTTILVIIFPVALAAIFYQLEPFEPVEFPSRELPRRTTSAPAVNPRMRIGSEVVGEGKVDGPEDLAYDKRNRLIYTGCVDGWIKRITVNKSAADSVVKNWVNTGGRPLGLALEKTGELIVADAYLVSSKNESQYIMLYLYAVIFRIKHMYYFL
ncbi:hypothetical protein KIW84_043142 [Lathyrus oleraceus]|uniref:Strictosidine synthase conserved region domain-containing protein n=1 Tax=Pisum sativum TaxID=3888 RepID=A0A9D4XGP4_PEA|nr:hypothetical protein KIW84_043142 [Pisum sativum]